MALMGYLKNNVERVSGSVTFNGEQILGNHSSQRSLRKKHWGQSIALIPQNAGTSLTPTMTARNQLRESLRKNNNKDESEIIRLLQQVNIPDPQQAQFKYPHELSGGQQQRLVIAIALASNPKLLLLDEPTSGLDPANTQALIQLLSRIRQQQQTTMVMISHDLELIQSIADRMAVMEKGTLLKPAPVSDILNTQHHSGIARLFNAAKPDLKVIEPQVSGNCLMKCQQMAFSYQKKGLFSKRQERTVVEFVNLDIHRGETVIITGHSGCGKTTVLKCIAGLESITSGSIIFNQTLLPSLKQRKLSTKQQIQMIFQNSDLALNPAHTVEITLQAPLKCYFSYDKNIIKLRVSELLSMVNLPDSYRNKYPNQLSGGEKQRVAIARACAAKPSLLLCDEITAALDVINRNNVLTLLKKLIRTEGCACLMVTHEQEVIRQMAGRVYEMHQGNIKPHPTQEQIRKNMLTSCPQQLSAMGGGTLRYSRERFMALG